VTTKIMLAVVSAGLLAAAMPAWADPTWTDEQEICVKLDDALLTRPPYLTHWRHDPVPDNGLEILSATLTVYAEGVTEGDKVLISALKGFRPHVLGYLEPFEENGMNGLLPNHVGNGDCGNGECCDPSKVSKTTFDLDPEWLDDEKYVALVKSFTLCNPNTEVKICKSVLDVAFVPTPGAALMGFIGLTTIGWVKKRRRR